MILQSQYFYCSRFSQLSLITRAPYKSSISFRFFSYSAKNCVQFFNKVFRSSTDRRYLKKKISVSFKHWKTRIVFWESVEIRTCIGAKNSFLFVFIISRKRRFSRLSIDQFFNSWFILIYRARNGRILLIPEKLHRSIVRTTRFRKISDLLFKKCINIELMKVLIGNYKVD